MTVLQSPDCQPPQGGSRSSTPAVCPRPSTLGTWPSSSHVLLPFFLPMVPSAPEEQSFFFILDSIKISGHSFVLTISAANFSCFLKSNRRSQSLAVVRSPVDLRLLVTEPPPFTKLISVCFVCTGSFFFLAASRLAAISLLKDLVTCVTVLVIGGGDIISHEFCCTCMLKILNNIKNCKRNDNFQ